MLIHHYDPATGEYLSSGQPDADPRNDGRWLIPASATLDAPPARTPTTWPFYRDGAWFLLPDYAAASAIGRTRASRSRSRSRARRRPTSA